MSEPIGVLVEQGKKRAVASAFDWPGWGRSAKSEPDALVVLGAYRPRYAKVAELAGLGDAFAAAGALAVVERLDGTGMGDFYGVSGTTAAPEYEQMSEDECDRKGRGGHLPGRMAGSERPARPPRRLQCGDPGAQRPGCIGAELDPWPGNPMGVSGYIAVVRAGRTIRPRRKPHADDEPRPGAATSEADVRLFKRKPKDDEPVDMNARSPETGLKYKDLALLGQMLKAGADLTKPRHALYYLYFGSPDVASSGAEEARAAGYDCAVGEPLPQYPGQWSMICERHDVVLDVDGVRSADDLFQGIADRLQGEFDGWEAAV